jgi:nucleoside-diphosphate-sugar epimerase
MKVLVIGGTGYIGTHVVKRLLDAGHDPAIFHRGQTNAELPPDVCHIFGVRQRLSDFRDEFKQLAPQVVLDVMPYVERDALTVTQTFRGIAERVVAISSQDVYRSFGILWHLENTPANVTPIVEDAPLRSVLYLYRQLAGGTDDLKYNYDKIPVERVFMSDADLSGTVLRLPAVYGIGDTKHRLFDYLKRMDDRRPFIQLENDFANWRWTRGYVENVADAIVLAISDERAKNRIYNIGEPEALTETEWVKSIARAVGWNGEIIAMPRAELPEHLKPRIWFEHDLYADTTRIRSELDYKERVSRTEALWKTVSWERANPPTDLEPNQFDYAAEGAALTTWQSK